MQARVLSCSHQEASRREEAPTYGAAFERIRFQPAMQASIQMHRRAIDRPERTVGFIELLSLHADPKALSSVVPILTQPILPNHSLWHKTMNGRMLCTYRRIRLEDPIMACCP